MRLSIRENDSVCGAWEIRRERYIFIFRDQILGSFVRTVSLFFYEFVWKIDLDNLRGECSIIIHQLEGNFRLKTDWLFKALYSSKMEPSLPFLGKLQKLIC